MFPIPLHAGTPEGRPGSNPGGGVLSMTPTSNPETLYDLMQSLIDNSVAVTQVTAELSNLNARLSETNKRLEAFTEEIRKTLKDHEERLVDVEHNCRKVGDWNRCWNRIEALEKSEHKRTGAQPVIDRAMNILQAVIVAAIVALVLFFMKGGAIT